MWSTYVLEKGINNTYQFDGLPPFHFRSRLPHPAEVISPPLNLFFFILPITSFSFLYLYKFSTCETRPGHPD